MSRIFQETEVHSQARRQDFQIEINLGEAIVTGNGAMLVPIPRIFWGSHGKSMEFLRQDGHVQTPFKKIKNTSKHRSCSGETHFNLILLGTLKTAVARDRRGMEPN